MSGLICRHDYPNLVVNFDKGYGMNNVVRAIILAGGIFAYVGSASASGEITVRNTCDYAADVRVFNEADIVVAAALASYLGLEPGRTFEMKIYKELKEYKISVSKHLHLSPDHWHANVKLASSIDLC